MKYYNSRYNFVFATEQGSVLYNARTGAAILLSGDNKDIIAKNLEGDRRYFNKDDFDEITFQSFEANGILVREVDDELLEIRESYWSARGSTPVVLTMTTTMDCNLGCYYCYENRTQHKLVFSDLHDILKKLEAIFSNPQRTSLHVDWYGGEPLLNLEFLEQASIAIQEFCLSKKINYHASVISNGTLWPENLEKFVARHKIRQVQISFDGLKQNHNKRRRYRKEYTNQENDSFSKAVKLVDQLLNYVQVDVRFNIDWKNKNDIYGFIDFITERRWFNKKYRAVFQPARISSYSERSSFLEDKQLSLEEFDAIRKSVTEKLANTATIEESEVPDGYPYPKKYVCAALANSSFVVGADRLIYRCGLQVGEKNRAVSSISSQSNENFSDKVWWEDFDPTTLSSCSQCSFLPVCLGGCPKKHLEKDRRALDEQSAYWRNNLAGKVTRFFGYTLTNPVTLAEEQQFRSGYN